MKTSISTLLTSCSLSLLCACNPMPENGAKATNEAKVTKAASSVTKSSKTNVLLVIIDDLRVNLDKFYSKGAVQPNIDRLASQSVRFSQAYANVPVCGASRASLMTGMLPTKDRFIDYATWADQDAPDAITLPQAFKEQGYTTHGIGKVYHHIGDAQQSWSVPAWNPHYHSNTPSPTWRNYITPERLAIEKAGQPSVYEAPDVEDNAYYDGQHADRAIEFIKAQQNNERPFFLALGFVKPHLPFNAPKKYWDLYDPAEINVTDIGPSKDTPKTAWHNFGEIRAYREIPDSPEVIDAETSRKLIHGYLAGLSYSDAQMGRVLDALKEQGLEDNTIVVFISDHGYSLGEHELWVKHSTYNVAMQAPMMFKVPGLKGGEVRQGLTEYIDLYPTLTDLAGIKAPAKQLDGQSLLPRLRNANLPGKAAIYPRWKNADTVYTGKHLYTEWVGKNGKPQGKMLYDHSVDPDERVNVVNDPAYDQVVKNLAAKVQAHREKLAGGVNNKGLKSVKTDEKLLALTFDDGPYKKITPKLLELLKQYDAKATFFNIGRKMQPNAEHVEAVLAAGHEIGNHSWNHARLPELSKDEQRRQIEDFQKQAQKLGTTPRIFRAPFLKTNADTLALLEEFNLQLISAQVMANDAGKKASKESVINKVQNRTGPGVVILMHEREHTYQALRALLPKWQQEGYQFVTVSELMSMAEE